MKKALIIFLSILALGFGGIFLIFKNNVSPKPDVAAMNDAVMTAMQGDDITEAVGLLTDQLLSEYEGMNDAGKDRDLRLQAILCVYVCVIAAVGAWLYHYCERSVLMPFRKLRRFAKDVAQGNLDIPLEMDRHGRFGAFSESFDLMREELKKARENERAADRSKKELVASLSHDIRTPVASIKAAVELMLLSVGNEREKAQLERIGEKAEQINTLITDMFHATLEELQALSVTVAEVHSTVIPDLVKSADYKGRVRPFAVPNCIVLADVIRLQQVFDNVIGNSYKYADTDIEINTSFEGQYLIIDIVDHGAGVPDDELPLLTSKFYRGKNADEKNGYGLGLYISNTLLMQMSGELRLENRQDGFAVRIMLRLAGTAFS